MQFASLLHLGASGLEPCRTGAGPLFDDRRSQHARAHGWRPQERNPTFSSVSLCSLLVAMLSARLRMVISSTRRVFASWG